MTMGTERTETLRTLHPCDVKIEGKPYPVYVILDSQDEKGRLSIMGAIGSLDPNYALGWGQINSLFRMRHPRREDRGTCRYELEDLSFTSGWTEDLWLDLLDTWKRWHLNDMRAECEHQRAMGWKYKDHEGEACPVCGYHIGSAWLREEVPQAVLAMLAALPDADKLPPPVWLR